MRRRDVFCRLPNALHKSSQDVLAKRAADALRFEEERPLQRPLHALVNDQTSSRRKEGQGGLTARICRRLFLCTNLFLQTLGFPTCGCDSLLDITLTLRHIDSSNRCDIKTRFDCKLSAYDSENSCCWRQRKETVCGRRRFVDEKTVKCSGSPWRRRDGGTSEWEKDKACVNDLCSDVWCRDKNYVIMPIFPSNNDYLSVTIWSLSSWQIQLVIRHSYRYHTFDSRGADAQNID